LSRRAASGRERRIADLTRIERAVAAARARRAGQPADLPRGTHAAYPWWVAGLDAGRHPSVTALHVALRAVEPARRPVAAAAGLIRRIARLAGIDGAVAARRARGARVSAHLARGAVAL